MVEKIDPTMELRSLRVAVTELQKRYGQHNEECTKRSQYLNRVITLGLVGMVLCASMIFLNALKIFGVI